MFTTFLFVSLFVALFRSVIAQGSNFTIDTPSLVQCQVAQITWSDTGNLPYDLLVVPADDMCGESLEDLGNQTSTFLAWIVNLAAGTDVVLSLEDSAGNEAWSGSIIIGESNDSSCLGTTPGTPFSPSSPSSTTPIFPSSTSRTPTPYPSPTSSVSTPGGGAANAGSNPSASSALSTRPFSAATFVGAAVFAAVVFAL